jgi:redox-sensitive bicupin YhaK (pirin superfamily)
MKKILRITDPPRPHWVGDGFHVRSLFSYNGDTKQFSPFLLLDYASPAKFEPGTKRRGVGEHPHRGFETVTIVYQGELEHRDSTGAGGKIGPGDVQWMTAARGILHEEFHSQLFTQSGGTMEMVQLWVNLPAKDKMSKPGYQTLLDANIPVVDLPDGAGRVRVIAGEFKGHKGPAHTFTPIDVWDVRLSKDRSAKFEIPEGRTIAVTVLHGPVLINGEIARDAQLVSLDRAGTELHIEANDDAKVLVLSGDPIDEPVVGYGPFVMNSSAEIETAMRDFNSGRFGAMPAETTPAS